MQMNEIYQRMILDDAKQAVNQPLLTGDGVKHARLNNPSCGDRIELTAEVNGGYLARVHFQNDGCIISSASLSIMVRQCQNQSIATVRLLIDDFATLMMGQTLADEQIDRLGDAVALQAIVKLPVRIKCAMLPWKALAQAINGGEDD